MIDPTQLPLLLKVLDFLFDEGRKILQERREIRQAERQKGNLQPSNEHKMSDSQASSDSEESLQTSNLSAETGSVELTQSAGVSLSTKDDFMGQKVIDEEWTLYETELAHTFELMEIYTRNYRLAKEQVAMWGEAMVPQIILHNLREAESGLISSQHRVQEILSKIYGKKVNILDQGSIE